LLLTGRGITLGSISVGSRAHFEAMNQADRDGKLYALPVATSAFVQMWWERVCLGVPHFMTTSIIGEPSSHRRFGRKCLRVSFAEVVATLGPSCREIFRSLMISIDQGIIVEREQTLSESIDGVLFCGGEHLLGEPRRT
jgi:hypothetical protein